MSTKLYQKIFMVHCTERSELQLIAREARDRLDRGNANVVRFPFHLLLSVD